MDGSLENPETPLTHGQGRPDQTAAGSVAPEHPLRWRMLAFLSVAILLSMTVWFSTNAIAPALEIEKGFSTGDIV